MVQVALEGLTGLQGKLKVSDHELYLILDPLDNLKHLCGTLLLIIDLILVFHVGGPATWE